MQYKYVHSDGTQEAIDSVQVIQGNYVLFKGKDFRVINGVSKQHLICFIQTNDGANDRPTKLKFEGSL